MPTRIDWLPYGIKERKRALALIASQIDNFSSRLGLTTAQVDRIKAIAVEYAFAVDIYELNRVTNVALRIWRDSVISNERSIKLAGERPIYNNSPAPAGTRLGLIFEIRQLVGVIKASPGFDDGIGNSLGIMTPNHEKKLLRDMKPEPTVKVFSGYRVKIACQKENMDAVQVEYRRNGDAKFRIVAFLTRLPETIEIEPAAAGEPESGRIRCQFIKKNKIVGNPSNESPVTLYTV